ncbi:short-chain dehydrogenase/reductase [Sphingobacteriaceae bacterium]|nr:short-chain dehydrogenase/reductase [Sphingobacteriaceae bacterium]
MDNQKKIILVTGASSGMGEDFVKSLLKDGHIVYGAARRLERMDAIKRAGAKVLDLDVTNDESMINCVATIIKNEKKIDILVNSAGFGLNAAVEDVSIADAKYQFEVNVFGVARLIQLVLPHMRAQRSGKIINISSVAGKVSSPMAGWYHASKHALEALSDSLRLETKQFGIDVVIIEPGSVKSEWGAIAMDKTFKISGDGPYKAMAKAYIANVKAFDPKGSDPSVITNLLQKAIAAKKPKTRYAGGFMAVPLLIMRKLLSDKAFDAILLSQLKPKK